MVFTQRIWSVPYQLHCWTPEELLLDEEATELLELEDTVLLEDEEELLTDDDELLDDELAPTMPYGAGCAAQSA